MIAWEDNACLFLHSSVQTLNSCVTETKLKKHVHKIRFRKNNQSLTDNGLVFLVQNHMACSLLEWLYYNVTCIVWISNNIHGCCSRVTDSSWWVYKYRKHRGAGTFCSLHAQEYQKNTQRPWNSNTFKWKAELFQGTSLYSDHWRGEDVC